MPSEPTSSCARFGVGREQGVEVVASDPALDAREPRLDLGALGLGEPEHAAGEAGCGGGVEADGRAVGEPGLDGEDVVDHLAVGERAGAAGVVAGHAAEGAAAGGGGLHREEQAVRAQPGVEALEHHARPDLGGQGVGVERDEAVEVPAEVEDEAGADRLAVLRGAAAAGDHRNVVLGGDRERRRHVVGVAGKGDGERHDLVDRGVGGVAAPAEGVGGDAAAQVRDQCPGQRLRPTRVARRGRRPQRCRHRTLPCGAPTKAPGGAGLNGVRPRGPNQCRD